MKEFLFTPQRLILGRHYIVRHSKFYSKMTLCKFIKVTACWYNLLNLDTNKCILKHHLYPNKKDKQGNLFFINKEINLNIVDNNITISWH